MLKKYAVIIVVVLFLVIGMNRGSDSVEVTTDVTAKGPEIVIFPANLGSVSFGHRMHQDQLEGKCDHCHHPLAANSLRQRCRDCHKRKAETTDNDPASFYDIKMSLCRGCHREKLNVDKTSIAPVNCKGCHNVKEIRFQ